MAVDAGSLAVATPLAATGSLATTLLAAGTLAATGALTAGALTTGLGVAGVLGGWPSKNTVLPIHANAPNTMMPNTHLAQAMPDFSVVTGATGGGVLRKGAASAVAATVAFSAKYWSPQERMPATKVKALGMPKAANNFGLKILLKNDYCATNWP